MAHQMDELADPNSFVDELNATTPEAELVVHIRWAHAVVGFMIVLVMIGALGAGLWFGRSWTRAGAVAQASLTTPGQPQAIQPRPLQGVSSLARPLQSQPLPQVRPAQARPKSSAGVTTSIGGTPNVGDPAPDFTLKNLQGEEVRLSDYRGRPVLINFWATWCPPCRFEMPAIQKMYDTYKDEGFEVLAVDVEESITTVKRYIAQGGYTFPVLLDYKGEVANGPYRIRAFPTSYFVGRDGKIAVAHRGMMTEQILQQYMDRVLATEN